EKLVMTAAPAAMKIARSTRAISTPTSGLCGPDPARGGGCDRGLQEDPACDTHLDSSGRLSTTAAPQLIGHP
ncbi:hypothetical protein ACWCO9_36510, partial [Streptomyces sp. NPDC001937]